MRYQHLIHTAYDEVEAKSTLRLVARVPLLPVVLQASPVVNGTRQIMHYGCTKPTPVICDARDDVRPESITPVD